MPEIKPLIIHKPSYEEIMNCMRLDQSDNSSYLSLENRDQEEEYIDIRSFSTCVTSSVHFSSVKQSS